MAKANMDCGLQSREFRLNFSLVKCNFSNYAALCLETSKFKERVVLSCFIAHLLVQTTDSLNKFMNGKAESGEGSTWQTRTHGRPAAEPAMTASAKVDLPLPGGPMRTTITGLPPRPASNLSSAPVPAAKWIEAADTRVLATTAAQDNYRNEWPYPEKKWSRAHLCFQSEEVERKRSCCRRRRPSRVTDEFVGWRNGYSALGSLGYRPGATARKRTKGRGASTNCWARQNLSRPSCSTIH
jgi:hypothetical protein